MLSFFLHVYESKMRTINYLLSFSWYYVVDFMEWKKLNVIVLNCWIDLLDWIGLNHLYNELLIVIEL